jgi:hypothetical protein
MIASLVGIYTSSHTAVKLGGCNVTQVIRLPICS